MKNASYLFGTLALICLTACATGKGAAGGAADLTVVIAKENARIGDETFDIRDYDALEAGLAGACASGCELIEVRATPEARYDAIRTVYDAAVKGRAGKMRMTLGGRGSGPLAPTLPSSCRSEIDVRKTGIDIYIDGEVLPPDDDCADWTATACSDDSDDPINGYEWTEVEARVQKFRPRFQGPVCLYMERDMSAALLVHLMQTVRGEAPTASFALLRNRPRGKVEHDAVTQRMVENSSALTGCYDAEIEGGATTSMSLTLRFVIGPGGKVARAGVVDGQGTTPKFEACLVDAIGTVEFPAPDNGGNYLINYPLNFAPAPN